MTISIRTILTASVGMNLILAGVIAGQGLRQADFPPPPPGPPSHQFSHKSGRMMALQELVEPEHRQLLADAMENKRKQTEDLFPQIEEAREKMHGLMVAEKFDADAFKAQLDALDQLQARGFLRMGGMLLEIMPQLSQQERIAIAEHLKEHRPPGPPPEEGGPPPGDGNMPPPPHGRHMPPHGQPPEHAGHPPGDFPPMPMHEGDFPRDDFAPEDAPPFEPPEHDLTPGDFPVPADDKE